jgi:hypothetical protein
MTKKFFKKKQPHEDVELQEPHFDSQLTSEMIQEESDMHTVEEPTVKSVKNKKEVHNKFSKFKKTQGE